MSGTSDGVEEDVAGLEEIQIAIDEAPDHRGDRARMSTEVCQLDAKLTLISLRIAEMKERVAIHPLDDDVQIQ